MRRIIENHCDIILEVIRTINKKPVHVIVDLDDTLVENVNTTYNFIRDYLTERYGPLGLLRYFAYLITSKLLYLLQVSDISRRRVAISLLLGLEPISRLEKFAIFWVRKILRNIDRQLLYCIKKIEKGRKELIIILATASINPPVLSICRFLKFNYCIYTPLSTWNKRVTGISLDRDTYAYLKFYVLFKKLGISAFINAIYIADLDSIKVEKAFRFVKVIIVKGLNKAIEV